MTTTRDAHPEPGFTTRQLHAGLGGDVGVTPRALPIYLTAGFELGGFDAGEAHFRTGDGYSYTRVANPTLTAVEERIADLEGGAEALLVGTGQAAVAIALIGLLRAGDHLVSSAHLYEGTRGFLLENLAALGIEVSFVDEPADPAAWERAIRPSTRVLFGETVSNPTNDVLDIAAVAGVAHGHGIPLVVDGTFTSPYLLRPIEHGADIVVHSASKFLAGHGAVLGGVIVDNGAFDAERSGALFPQLVAPSRLGAPSFAEREGGLARIAYLRDVVALRFGPTASPFNAFLINQGIETLSLRVQRQTENALAVARFLERRSEVASVDHAGLESHPSHALAERYLPRGVGSVFSITLRGGLPAARAFVDASQLFTHMSHLGDVRSLVQHPETSSHSSRTVEERLRSGIHPGTLRLSIGIEDIDDLLADLAQALDAARFAASSEDAAAARTAVPEDAVA
jgi:O-acetylhomoserine (thiol)-lyase